MSALARGGVLLEERGVEAEGKGDGEREGVEGEGSRERKREGIKEKGFKEKGVNTGVSVIASNSPSYFSKTPMKPAPYFA